MKYIPASIQNRAMTLIEVVFAAALLLLVFGAIMSAFMTITALIGSTKAQAGAVSLANARMEYIRSLPYDSVGTVAGIPNGLIPQISTTSLNGITYTQRVLIEYVDDAKDGVGAADSNAILADYKLAKVSYSWDQKGVTHTISLISNIVPRGIETSTGGGTLWVNVFDAQVQPVSGAAVHVYNDTGTSSVIDTVRYTNSAGIAMFSGAPARSGYQITVTGSGYSTDQTYSASATNSNPITPHVAVLKNQVSTMNFQIDKLSNLTIHTQSVPITNTFEDLFTDLTKTATATNIAIVGGNVQLQGAPGSYLSAGALFSAVVTPTPVASWDTVSYEGSVPSNTTLKVFVYGVSGTSTLTLLPDTVLPGNSTGLLPGTFSLEGVPVATYTSLQLQAVLLSSSTSATPLISSWNIGYTESKNALPSIPVTLTGVKKIGTNGVTPVYKYVKSFTTNGSGNLALTNLEWDVYDTQVTDVSYTVAESCKNIPYVLSPDVSDTLTISLAPATTDSLRVVVVDGSGAVIPNATLTLTKSGFNQSKVTSACGQVFFGSGVSSAADYTLDLSAFGYTSQSVTPVSIAGNESLVVTLNK